MPKQRQEVQPLTVPQSDGNQAVRLPTLRKCDALGITQRPLRFAHLPEMNEQGDRQIRIGATEHGGQDLCFRTFAGHTQLCAGHTLGSVAMGSVLQNTLPTPRIAVHLSIYDHGYLQLSEIKMCNHKAYVPVLACVVGFRPESSSCSSLLVTQYVCRFINAF